MEEHQASTSEDLGEELEAFTKFKALQLASIHLESMGMLKESATLNMVCGKCSYDPVRGARLRLVNFNIPKFWKLIHEGDFKSLQELLNSYPVLANVRKHVVSNVAQEGGNITQDTFAGLAFAACLGNVEVVQVLLKAGADVHARMDESKSTPLLIASRQGHFRIAQLLLKAGSDVNACNKNGILH